MADHHHHLPQKPIIVGEKYKLGKKIGSGSFGEVYQATNLFDGEEVAVKFEHKNIPHPQLQHECRVYKFLYSKPQDSRVYWYGEDKDYNILVMKLLGPSLEDIFNFCSRKFDLKTITWLAVDMIMKIENLHNRSIIHRDIKPENFLIKPFKNYKFMNIIDFGLAKKFRSIRTRYHIPYCENKSLVGTARYASINSHKGIEQSRRDDLESVAYILIYFFNGKLPWQNIKTATKQQKYDRILELKMSIPIDELCKDMPIEFSLFLKSTRELAFEECPNYIEYMFNFAQILRRMGLPTKPDYDWAFLDNNKSSNLIDDNENINSK